MNSEPDKLSLGIIEALKNKGLSQSEIARMYGVTRQYVSWIKHTYGGRLTPRERILKEFPFKVPVQFANTAPYKRLRDHGEFVATGGIGMSHDKISRLRGWYKKLREENLVVEFDPNLPPEPGVSYAGGWAYRKRRKSDGNLLIRVNSHTNLSEEGEAIWRFPNYEP